MLSARTLASWIRAEYQRMPGLKLTREQACRLWSVRDDTCEQALQELIDEGFLHRTGTGSFVCLPRPQRNTAVPPPPVRQVHLRCPHCLHRLSIRDDERLSHASSYRCEGCRRVVSFTALSA